MKKLLTILLVLYSFFAFSQQKTLQNLIEKISPTGFSGFSIYNPVEDRFIYNFNAEKHFIPASNQKIFTFYNTISSPNDSIPALMYVEKQDTIFVKTLGDPTYLDQRFSSEKIDSFFTKTQKIIALDVSFSKAKYANGWTWDDYQYSYMPERNAFPIAGNIVSKKDSLAHYFIYKNNVQLNERREFHRNIFNTNTSKKVPFITSDSLILSILKNRYHKNIILRNNKSFFITSNNVKWLYSNPKTIVLKELMLESDNFIAEQLAYQNEIIPRQKEGNKIGGIPIEKNKMYDGSGLSRYNLVTPLQMIEVLKKCQTQPNYLDYFPVNGVSGTLKNSYKTQKSYIFAKTGSMSGVYNISGFLKTDSGKLLIFSLLNNNHSTKGKVLKPHIEKLLLYIKRNF